MCQIVSTYHGFGLALESHPCCSLIFDRFACAQLRETSPKRTWDRKLGRPGRLGRWDSGTVQRGTHVFLEIVFFFPRIFAFSTLVFFCSAFMCLTLLVFVCSDMFGCCLCLLKRLSLVLAALLKLIIPNPYSQPICVLPHAEVMMECKQKPMKGN